jgi:8-amino-7-oxononanoate synthase
MDSAPGSWDTWVSSQLDDIRLADRWRQLRPLDGRGPCFDGPLVSFASNDYLGLAAHPALRAAAVEAAVRYGTGTGSSRLIVGDRPVHHDLEQALAEWRGAPAALVFPSGYQANLAVLTTMASAPGTRIVSDALNHASIIDGARLSKAEVCVYRHGDVEQAATLVRSAPGAVIVVSDSVFSMDGDVAPVEELSRLCNEAGALLVLDDAHSVFTLPPVDPAAACLRVGTLSKALGAQGGFVTGRRDFVDLLVNRGRSFIFTTGLSPMAAAAGLAAVEIVRSREGQRLTQRLRHHIDRLRPAHPSPILPVVVGSERKALDAADALRDAGLLVPAIRPPTVPAGTSRLRISLSAAHSDGDVDRLARALETL